MVWRSRGAESFRKRSLHRRTAAQDAGRCEERQDSALAEAVRRLQTGLVSLKAALVQAALPRVREFLKHDKVTDRPVRLRRPDRATSSRRLKARKARELIEALRRRYQVALIDEFQDTDELQWRFFDRVFIQSEGRHRAYLIGDPKQAIYGFRGGDVVHLSASARQIVQGPENARRAAVTQLSLDRSS